MAPWPAASDEGIVLLVLNGSIYNTHALVVHMMRGIACVVSKNIMRALSAIVHYNAVTEV